MSLQRPPLVPSVIDLLPFARIAAQREKQSLKRITSGDVLMRSPGHVAIPNDESVRFAADAELPSDARFGRSAGRAAKGNLSLTPAGSAYLGDHAGSHTKRSTCGVGGLRRYLACADSLRCYRPRRDAVARM